MKKLIYFFSLIMLLIACGTKEDDQINDIFKQGKIDPNLIPNTIGYVPMFPFFTNFSNPVDVYVGYDEMVYVVDDNGLNVLDQTGKIMQTIPIPGATDVTQDRRLHTYVIGRVNDPLLGNRAAVYHLTQTATSNYTFVDTLIHPINDESRNTTANRGADDEAVEFTGIATLADNSLYVTRKGPRNDVNSFVRPDNGVLIFNENGKNTGFALGLNPETPSLKSAIGISSIATWCAPPQRLQGMSTSKNFLITQAEQGKSIEFRTQVITVVDDPDAGTEYLETPSLLVQDKSKADRFLYESFRFKNPEDCYVSPDNLGYIFVVDSETDSLYVFTSLGLEGVNPPANSGITKQVIVSFGGKSADGTNTGPFSFNDPSGVCYNRKIIYVADKKNNRICRYKLSTDLE
ncbi:MAG: hypothetical protein IT246_07010 [Bacteroidia bacterium]|nr:hypothetical protein [Bacteroidia bacterium]